MRDVGWIGDGGATNLTGRPGTAGTEGRVGSDFYAGVEVVGTGYTDDGTLEKR